MNTLRAIISDRFRHQEKGNEGKRITCNFEIKNVKPIKSGRIIHQKGIFE
jgi:hypothetical protein